jgi:hypothetical protein
MHFAPVVPNSEIPMPRIAPTAGERRLPKVGRRVIVSHRMEGEPWQSRPRTPG